MWGVRDIAKYGASWAFALLMLVARPVRASEIGAPIPVLKYVGIIPAQWIGDKQFVTADQEAELRDTFSTVVRESKRFQVLNDEVVADLWGNPQGRDELRREYELHALFNLQIKNSSDMVSMTVRLLGPALDNYLIESETLSRSWFEGAKPDEIKERLENLVFRLINRLPVDVSVTSVQGRFITVSGGEEQGIRNGDELTFQRVTVASLHPANQSWLGFAAKKLGQAKIIEVKKNASVAEMTDQSYDGAIKIGDGAKVTGLNSRKKFARNDAEEQFKQSRESVIIPPTGMAQKQSAAAPKTETAASVVAEQPKPTSPQETAQPTEANQAIQKPEGAEAKPGEAVAEKPAKEEESSPANFMAALGKHFDSLTIGFGPDLWSASGSASASSQIPPWLLSRADVRFGQQVNDAIRIDYKGNFGFGPTSKGSFFGFGVGGDLYYLMPFKGVMPGVETAKLGMLAQYQSMGVDGQTYGGSDVFSFGALVGVNGKALMNESAKAIDWDLSFSFIPQAFGKVGTKGGKRDVVSVFGYQFAGNAVVVSRPKTWEWGGTASYGTMDYELSKKGLVYSDFFVGALTRYRF